MDKCHFINTIKHLHLIPFNSNSRTISVYKALCARELRDARYICCFVCFFWLCWVFIATHGLSLAAASGGYSLLRCVGFSLRWLLLLWSTGSRHMGFSNCGTQAQQLWLTGSGAQQLWRMGLVAPRHRESSRTRDRTHGPCIGRWILNHCTTREVPQGTF